MLHDGPIKRCIADHVFKLSSQKILILASNSFYWRLHNLTVSLTFIIAELMSSNIHCCSRSSISSRNVPSLYKCNQKRDLKSFSSFEESSSKSRFVFHVSQDCENWYS